MTNLHPSKGTTTLGTALITKHAGWAAARAGEEAWIIDSGNTPDEDNWFTYTTDNINRLHQIRKLYCKRLREGRTL